MINGSKIFVEYIDLPPSKLLQQEWLELEAQSDASYFTSWSWIGCWLSCLPDNIKPKLLRATMEKRVVGLGLLVPRHFRRHRILPVNGLFLNATGDPLIDEIYIEYNGFLVNRTLEHIVVPSLYEYIATMLYQWEEFYFDGVSEHMNLQSNALINMKTQRRRESINYVDLDEVRKVGGNYISLLGPNTRYNIRRSIKEFNKVGPITLTVAENMDEALDYLSKLKELHQAYWQSKGKPGSFSNAFFERFHDNLIRTRFRYGDIQLIQANAGNFSIGYLYNFLYRGTVYNYQTGFNYSICKSQFRPGFVAHSQAIELNANLGQNIYDFMAGESGYKKSLGTHTRNLDWLLLQRDLLKFRLEDKLRQIKYCFIPEPKAQVEN